MINISSQSYAVLKHLKKQTGALTLITTVILLVTTTLIVIFAAGYGVMQSKMATNLSRGGQAFEAAEAGLEFGIQYLQRNSATILAAPTGGYINAFSNASTSNVALANNSKFTITYTNPIQNNYTLIQVSSTGTSDDGTATRTVSQQVQFGSFLMAPPTLPVTTQGDVDIGGNASVINKISNSTIKSGGNTDIDGSGQTILNAGVSSTSGNVKSDVQRNSSLLSGMSQNDFFANFFGVSATTMKNNASNYFTSNNSHDYSSQLNGLTGTTIWIDQTSGTASISGSTVVGTSANPVLLIVNGDFHMSGSAIVNGFVYVVGGSTDTDLTGTMAINGGIATGGDLSLKGHITITYNSVILTNLRNAMSYYAKVPGTWKDF